jgi:hypothetical protein
LVLAHKKAYGRASMFLWCSREQKITTFLAKNVVAVSECNNLIALLPTIEGVCTNAIYEERLLEPSSIIAYGSDGLDSYCT